MIQISDLMTVNDLISKLQELSPEDRRKPYFYWDAEYGYCFIDKKDYKVENLQLWLNNGRSNIFSTFRNGNDSVKIEVIALDI